MTSQPENHKVTKPLGVVWVTCSESTLPPGLEEALRAEAHVHRGPKPPVGTTLSCIVSCPIEEEAFASEIRRLQALAEGAPVLVFSSQPDPQVARKALQAGARGFIHAEMSPARIIFAVTLVCRGDIAFPLDGTLL